MMSALSKYESTYDTRAAGGGDLWYGLLQIYPDPTRIIAVTVERDQAVAVCYTRWRGAAADWGPMTKPKKIAEMSAWTSHQTYCQPPENTRPVARPKQG